MRQLLYNARKESFALPLKVMTTVDALTRYDMIYIYHHLFSGANLVLKQDRDYPLNSSAISVFYKGFKLGYLPEAVSKAVTKQFLCGNQVKATTVSLYKNKFMPLSGLDIELTFMEDKEEGSCM